MRGCLIIFSATTLIGIWNETIQNVMVTRVLKVIFRKQINTRFSVPVIVDAPRFTIWKAITRNSWKQSIKVEDSGVRWGKIRKRISIVKVLNQQSLSSSVVGNVAFTFLLLHNYITSVLHPFQSDRSDSLLLTNSILFFFT